MEIKVIDGKVNRFTHTISKLVPLYVEIKYGEKFYRTRASSFQKGEYFPVWNHTFFITIYQNISDIDLSLIEKGT